MQKSLNDILPLGDPRLYEVSANVQKEELDQVVDWVSQLHLVMEEVRSKFGFGRGIAAPQLGIMKRLFYLNVDKPVAIINPVIIDKSEEMFELWDDCMCFPNLLVKVKRHRKLTLVFKDEHWQQHEWTVEDDLAELVQHEYDHLDGILCTMRAIDNKSFK